MLNQPLIALVNSVLGTGKQTSKGNFAYHCPFCNHHKPKLEINFTENKKGENPWHCWVCDKRGKRLSQIFKQVNASPKAMEELRAIVKTETADKEIAVAEILNLPKEFKPLTNISKSDIIGRHALAYIKSRNISEEDVLKYNIGYCDDGDYKGRIIFPSYDIHGDINYFLGRSYSKFSKLKYKNPDIPKTEIIFK